MVLVQCRAKGWGKVLEAMRLDEKYQAADLEELLCLEAKLRMVYLR